MSDDFTPDETGLTPMLYPSPWNSPFDYAPWMAELHRPNQEVAFIRSNGEQLTPWTRTGRVFRLQCYIGTATHLDVRREGNVERIEFDKPIVFSGGDFESTWMKDLADPRSTISKWSNRGLAQRGGEETP